MKLTIRLLVLLLPVVAFAAPAASPPPLLAAAEELLRQVTPAQTTYKHKEPEVRWSTDPANPAYCHTDCSGLIIALLEHCYPHQFGDGAFKRWLDSGRPTARRFYDAVVAERGFRRVANVVEARPGDLIAVKYPPGGETTGHTMLIAEAPRRIEPETAPLVEGTKQWLVTVIDQAKSGHGAADTRREPDGTFRGGLGRGGLRIYTRADGSPIGYSWSTFADSKFYGIDERELAIGRFDPAFQP